MEKLNAIQISNRAYYARNAEKIKEKKREQSKQKKARQPKKKPDSKQPADAKKAKNPFNTSFSGGVDTQADPFRKSRQTQEEKKHMMIRRIIEDREMVKSLGIEDLISELYK